MKISTFVLHRRFKKQFKKLNKKVQLAFEYATYFFLDDPLHPSLNTHPLNGRWMDHWSINITGDIRAIYETRGNAAIFVAIGTHSELYP